MSETHEQHVPIRTKKQIVQDVPRRTKNKLEKTCPDVPRTNWKKRTNRKLETTYQDEMYQDMAICCCHVWASKNPMC